MIDYLSENLWLLWTLVCVLALILEVSSGTFYLLCFAVGAAVAIVSSFFGIALWAQVLVFVIFSCLCVFCVRPVVVKYLHTDRRNRKSNADALLGREGVAWRAVSKDGSNIDKGAIVKVVARESIVVTVEVAAEED